MHSKPRALGPIFARAALVLLGTAAPAYAGPPFQSDDPIPTDHLHYEVYAFGARASDASGAVGIDFNYGATPDLQLTATAPIEFQDDRVSDGELGNVELAAKWRFVHQDTFGWDVAVFPRVFLPSASDIGDESASLLVPIWLGRSGENWSTFGGGGCAIHRGGDARDYCLAGWTITHDITPSLHVGGEIFYHGADFGGGDATRQVGLGATYDVSETLHLLAYSAAGVGPSDGDDAAYASMLFTF